MVSSSETTLMVCNAIARPFCTKSLVLLTLPGLVGIGQVVLGCVALLVRLAVDTDLLHSKTKFGYCPPDFSTDATEDERQSVENEQAIFENIDLVITIVVGALMLLNICFVCAKRPTIQVVEDSLDITCHRTNVSLLDTRRSVPHWITMYYLGVIAVLHFALDIFMLVFKKRCILNFAMEGTWRGWHITWGVFVFFRLAYGVGTALTQGFFQCELMDDMSKCNNAISHLKDKWTTAYCRRQSYEVYHDSLMACRKDVKLLADHWFVPLSVNIAIHGVIVGICAAQIVLRIFFYQSRSSKLRGLHFDDPQGVFWYASLGIIYILQLCVFLPQLCSINTHADELVDFVMEEVKQPYDGLHLSDLKNLAEACPVSFPVMCFRLSTAKVSSALAAAMVSLIGLGLSVGKQHLTQCE